MTTQESRQEGAERTGGGPIDETSGRVNVHVSWRSLARIYSGMLVDCVITVRDLHSHGMPLRRGVAMYADMIRRSADHFAARSGVTRRRGELTTHFFARAYSAAMAKALDERLRNARG